MSSKILGMSHVAAAFVGAMVANIAWFQGDGRFFCVVALAIGLVMMAGLAESESGQ